MASVNTDNSLKQPVLMRNGIMRITALSVAVGVVAVLATGWMPYPISAWLGILIFSTYYILLLKNAPASAIMLMPLFGGVALTQFISGLFIEAGGYLSETKEMGSATSGFLRLAIVYIMLFGIAAMVIERYVERWKKSGLIERFIRGEVKPFRFLVYSMDVLMGFGLAYLIYAGARNGFPIFTGVDRFEFYRDLNDPIYTSIMGNRILALAYVGWMMALAKKPRFYFYLAGAILVVSAMLGDKFTEFVIALGLLGTPILCKTAWSVGHLPIRKIVYLGLGVVCITMPLVFMVYGGLSNSGDGLDRMKERMTLQGQLWFLADREVNDLVRFQTDPLIGDWEMMTSKEPTAENSRNDREHYQGMPYMLLHFAPPSDAYLRLKTGVVYCLGVHAYLLETLGWGGMLLANIFLGIIFGLISVGMIYSFVSGRLIYLLFFSKFFTFITSMLAMADIYMLINWKSLLFLVCLTFYRLIDVRYINRKSAHGHS